MKVNIQEHYAAIIGLDWADKKHDVCIMPSHTEQFEYSQFAHTPESIKDWSMAIHQRFPGQKIAICLELKSGPIVYALLQYPWFDLYPVAPSTLAKYREAFSSSGAKDDPSDAYLMVDFTLRHSDKLRLISPDNEETRILTRFVEQRRLLVSEKVRLTHRISRALKDYYPQALDWFSDIDSVIFCDFIKRWPNLKKVRRAHESTLIGFFHQHHVRYQSRIDKRLEGIKNAIPLTEDNAVIEPSENYVLCLVKMLRNMLNTLHEYDQKIAEHFKNHPDHEIFQSFPGAGPVFAPRLLTAMGSKRNRFANSDELVRQIGVAPVVKRSGQSTWIHWRYNCPKFVRQTFVEWANQSIHYSYWARIYYEQQEAKGKARQTILRSLAYKWARIVYRCWKNHEPYNEARYLMALKDKGSPLVT